MVKSISLLTNSFKHNELNLSSYDQINWSTNNFEGKIIENDLHMSEESYVIMGQRFAEQAVELIEKNKDKTNLT